VEDALKDLAEIKKRTLAKRKLKFENPKMSTSEDKPEVGKKKRHDDSKKYTNTCIFV